MDTLYYTEKPRDIPVLGEYDVIVCGGGTSGIAAAIASARTGVKTVLLERYGFTGGVPAYCIMPAWHRLREIHSRLLGEFAERTASVGPGPNTLKTEHTEPEYVKITALNMLAESGVELHLHTLCTGAVVEEKNVRGVITESKSGRRAFLGKTLIDATGDGDIAFLAGAEYLQGDDEGITQGMTIRFRIGRINFDRYFDWVAENRQYYKNISDERIEDLRSKARDGKEFYMSGDLSPLYKLHPEYPNLPVSSYFNASSIRKDELSVNATRIYRVDGTKEEDLTLAEVTCRKQAFEVWRFLHEKIPGFENSVVIETAAQIGVRETRRIIGDYILTEADCRDGTRFPDAVAANPISFDLHDRNYSCESLAHAAYIPYRCLLPKGLEGLLTAGRCISSDHVANSTIRRMTTAFETGQAAGIAAALSAKMNLTPRNLPFETLKTALLEAGAGV